MLSFVVYVPVQVPARLTGGPTPPEGGPVTMSELLLQAAEAKAAANARMAGRPGAGIRIFMSVLRGTRLRQSKSVIEKRFTRVPAKSSKTHRDRPRPSAEESQNAHLPAVADGSHSENAVGERARRGSLEAPQRDRARHCVSANFALERGVQPARADCPEGSADARPLLMERRTRVELARAAVEVVGVDSVGARPRPGDA